MLDAAKNSEGYLLGVSLLNQGHLKTYFITKKFPRLDYLKVIGELEKLAIKDLKEM